MEQSLKKYNLGIDVSSGDTKKRPVPPWGGGAFWEQVASFVPKSWLRGIYIYIYTKSTRPPKAGLVGPKAQGPTQGPLGTQGPTLGPRTG